MLLIPAIHLKEGQCVPFKQEIPEESALFSGNPVEVARKWVSAGARRLHIMDVDGADRGEPVNADVIHDIVNAFPDLQIQVGGGIVRESTIDVYIQAGVRFIVIGTQAIKEPHFISDLCVEFPAHIIVGLDAHDGKVATEGWSKLSKHDAIDMAQHFEEDGVEAIIYTDIARDGTMQGVNIDATVKLAESINIPVIASGGIKNIENVKKLAEVASSGIIGVITSRAIYQGTLDFSEGQKAADAIANTSVFGL